MAACYRQSYRHSLAGRPTTRHPQGGMLPGPNRRLASAGTQCVPPAPGAPCGHGSKAAACGAPLCARPMHGPQQRRTWMDGACLQGDNRQSHRMRLGGGGTGAMQRRESGDQGRGSSQRVGLTGSSDRNSPLVTDAVMRGCSGKSGPHRTNPDAVCLGQRANRDRAETLKRKPGAVSRLSRVSRVDNGRVRVETGKQAGSRVRERVLSREPLCIHPRHPRHPRQSSGPRLSASRVCLG